VGRGPRRVAPENLARLRAASQLLHRPVSAKDPAEIARSVAGIQAQELKGHRLSFRSRSRKLTAADVDRARTEERSVLRTWLMRMTIHLIATEDAGWMLPLFEPPMERWSRRRLEQLGMPAKSVEKALRVITKALDDGPITRTEARERVKEAGIELRSQTDPQRSQMGQHIVGLAVLSGLAVLGPDRGAQSMLIRRDDWLGRTPEFDRDRALAELARRYIGAFAPATDRDFAYWSGLNLGDVRSGLEAIASELEEVRVGDQTMLALRGRLPRLPRAGQVRMIGMFDTFLLGYKDRTFTTGHRYGGIVSDGGGGIYPAILRDGLVVGGWRESRKGGGHEVTLTAPDSLPREIRSAVDVEIADIARFEGMG
jgi:Winged helix DNA-binding domain